MTNNMCNNNNPIVHIVDDDDAVRDSLSILLDSVDIANAGYPSAAVFLTSLERAGMSNQFGCVLLDVRMPGMSGLECQQELIALKCTLPIIFLTGHGDVPMAVEAMKNGALEFIQKPFREQELLDCIQKALLNNQQAQQELQYAKEIKTRLALLTKREKQVMQRVIAGQANKNIASELNLSQRTIEIHRANVMEKMQAKSLAQLVTMVVTQE
jgi:two-component system response regulator FixJ